MSKRYRAIAEEIREIQVDVQALQASLEEMVSSERWTADRRILTHKKSHDAVPVIIAILGGVAVTAAFMIEKLT